MIISIFSMPLKLLPITTIQDALEWYERNLCNVDLRDPRNFRVRFKCEHFIHHIKLKNKYGVEPKNRTLTIENIRAGKIQFVDGRYNPQRVSEIPWAAELATRPTCICPNWQAVGTGDENYVRNLVQKPRRNGGFWYVRRLDKQGISQLCLRERFEERI